jgi:hypothetical protein
MPSTNRTRENGRVRIDNQCHPKYDLYTTKEYLGARHKNAYLSGAACQKKEYPTLKKASDACLQSDCCGGVTQVGDRFSLRQGLTPLHSPSGEASWVKQETHGRSPNDGHDNQLQSIQTNTPLSRLFFSEDNQLILQNAMRYRVWQNTRNIIDTQDHLQLQIVMRSMFLQCAKHQPDRIAEQIRELNERVLEYCVPIVTSNLLQYLQYKKDVSQLPEPLEHAMNMSQRGGKTLSPNPFF